MTISTITAAVTTAITLGEDGYAGVLTVSRSGSVVPEGAGATAIYGRGTADGLTHLGRIAGATGRSGTAGGEGGIGVRFVAGSIGNSGTIAGGEGAGVQNGLTATGGNVTNGGTISGGQGGYPAALPAAAPSLFPPAPACRSVAARCSTAAS